VEQHHSRRHHSNHGNDHDGEVQRAAKHVAQQAEPRPSRHEAHAALWALAWSRLANLGVHWADVIAHGGSLRHPEAAPLIWIKKAAAAESIVSRDSEGRYRRLVMWWNDYWHTPWMFFGPVMMLAFFAVCVVLMFFMMRRTPHRHRPGRAIEILKERYARGEIDRAEFEERRRLLDA
jgi:putative membrane protein